MKIKRFKGFEVTKISAYDKVIAIIAGIIFTLFGSYYIIKNFPKAFDSVPVSYTYHFYSDSDDLSDHNQKSDKTWTESFPAYSMILWPPLFIIIGVTCFIHAISKNGRLKILMSGLTTLGLGLLLSYFFQHHFPIVTIPMIFVVIGIVIIFCAVTNTSKINIFKS